MTMTLRALSLNDHPLTQPITAHFDAEGGSIGRSDHNTLALPDPERHISRQHAEISVRGSAYLIKNVGSANPIIVRGQALARGESAPLVHRDQVRIGGYLLEVIHEAADDGEATTIARGRAAVDARTPAMARRGAASQGTGLAPRTTPGIASAGVGDLGAPLSRSNPFAQLLGDPVPAPLAPDPAGVAPPAKRALGGLSEARIDPFDNPQPAPAGMSPSSAAWATPRSAPGRPLLPDDFDPFAAPAPAPAAVPAAHAFAPSAGGGGFDDLIPSAAPASIDQLFGLQRGERDPLVDFMADLSPLNAAGSKAKPEAAMSTDPMALFGAAPVSPVSSEGMSTPADNVPELRAAFVPQAVRPTPVPSGAAANAAISDPMRDGDSRHAPARASIPTQRQAAGAASVAAPDDAWSGSPGELWKALCEGAGVSLDPPQGVNPELMRVVGGLLRAAVAGTLQLMMVRATAKHELRAQVTMIQARNNNPLKFSPDARSALEQMLQPPLRGFLAGPAAMTDAMHDLVGHTIGTMAGTRAALEGVLDRFTPQQLEAKLVGKSMLDSLLPMNRKAKLWELYLHHFDTIRNEAHDDFHTLFGRAFLAAYEQQLDRLQREESGKG